MYAKLLPFQELLLAAFFSASEQFLHFCHFACVVAGFKTAKKPNETAKNTDEMAKQIKSPKCGNCNGEKKLETAKI